MGLGGLKEPQSGPLPTALWFEAAAAAIDQNASVADRALNGSFRVMSSREPPVSFLPISALMISMPGDRFAPPASACLKAKGFQAARVSRMSGCLAVLAKLVIW